MKYKFRINNKPFEVDLLDIHSQPITAIVNGEVIDVWVDDENVNRKNITAAPLKSENKPDAPMPKLDNLPTPTTVNGGSAKSNVQSPIPGVVISINVRMGDEVQQGHELCVIEAMKMKNMIRSPRAGVIKLVNVRIGQAVQYHDTLFEYSE